MNTRPIFICPTLAFALLLAGTGHAGSWTGDLPQGGELRVDPDTHRAWRVDGGTARPMWDGVHRLEDGSVVIIREGTAVPTESMLRSWEGGAPSVEEMEGGPCEQLERRVCGHDNECRATAACLSARSLLNSEREAQRRAPFGAAARPETAAAADCTAALTDPKFPRCGGEVANAGPSPCQTLVDQVCGVDGRCQGSTACPPARQLLDQETHEMESGSRPGTITPSGAQCREALGNAFFAPCK